MKRLFQEQMSIILASGSPRRKDFLLNLRLKFEIIPARAPEPLCGKGESPAAFTMRSAALKAGEVYAGLADSLAGPSLIIGADTVVALDDEVMGKPENRADALAMLQSLAGRPHVVYTGCCCLFCGNGAEPREKLFFGESRVWMHDFSDAVLSAYINTGESMDKAGAYALQGVGAFLVKEVRGSWTNVVGLPLDELVQVMLENGAVCPYAGPDAGGVE